MTVPRQLVAIPTEHGGVTYRSRTEARWAIFFETAGITMQYEPEGFLLDGFSYLPDFFIPSWDLFVEVKPLAVLSVNESRKATLLASFSGKRVLVVLGEPAIRRGAIFGESLDWPRHNAFPARCRACYAAVLSYSFEDGTGYGEIALGPCGQPPYCTDKITPAGSGFEAAIEAATSFRWDPPPRGNPSPQDRRRRPWL